MSITRILKAISILSVIALPCLANAQTASLEEVAACENQRSIRNLTITSAEVRANYQSDNPYCYLRGIISPANNFKSAARK